VIYRLDTYDKALSYTGRILLEFQHNKRLRHDFGELIGKEAAVGDFTLRDPYTQSTVSRIVAFGANMSLRGFVNENDRPDVIINEDLQGREAAESAKRTDKDLRELLNDAYPSLASRNCKFVVAGNIICKNSLMDRLLSKHQHRMFTKRKYPAEYSDTNG